MNEQLLSKRLTRVGAHVPNSARLADIGSDHAYLPVALVVKNKIEFAVAGEVVQGPFQSASNQVKKSGVEHKIIVRLADGLAAIHPEDKINAITIAGMGGTLIASILEEGKRNRQLSRNERLILQPNVGEKNVREWLASNNYRIIHEEILEENEKIYEIIVADPCEITVEYSELERRFGPFLIRENSPVFRTKWKQELEQKVYVLNQLEKASFPPVEKIRQIKKEVEMIKEVLL